MPDWAKSRDEARSLAPGEPEECAWLLWIEARLASEGYRPIPAWWAEAYRAFWRSGKRQMVSSVGRRGTKSSSNMRVAVVETLFRKRRPEPGTELHWPILSCDLTEAGGRFSTLRQMLVAIGLREVDKQDKVDGGSFFATSNNFGRGRILLWDADGHAVEFRTSPASITGVSGFTALGGTCDEVDLWRDSSTGANPAGAVFEMLRPTLKGQKGAHLYAFSAPFGERGPHTVMARQGDTELQHVSRLGEFGARLDNEARRGLARYFGEKATTSALTSDRQRYATYANDRRLDERADPNDVAIPSWVANPTNADGEGPDPVGAVLECFSLASGEAGREGGDPLLELLARYGARPYAAGGHRLFDPVLLDAAMQRSA